MSMKRNDFILHTFMYNKKCNVNNYFKKEMDDNDGIKSTATKR